MKEMAPLTLAHRGHVADDVFNQLAAAILRGDLAAGEPLPGERDLEGRFGVSRVLVRQAIHRLAEIGLVRVRQGGKTLVLDPRDASDLRVLALFYRFAPDRSAADKADMIEKQYLQGLSIVEVASRRASKDALEAISAMVEAAAANKHDLSHIPEVEERFWRALATAAGNRIFRMEVAWWYENLSVRPLAPQVAAASPAVRIGFYQELARRLVAREAPLEYYLGVVRPILDALVVPPRKRAKKPARKA